MDGVAFAWSIKNSYPQRKPIFSRKSAAVDEVISKPFTLAEIDETIQS
jgi:hypothetical protein